MSILSTGAERLYSVPIFSATTVWSFSVSILSAGVEGLCCVPIFSATTVWTLVS